VRFPKFSECFFAFVLIASASAPIVAASDKAPDNPAQAHTSIDGTVTDKSGAVLPGAAVTVSNGAGFTQSATTNDRGEYSFTDLPAGTYSVTISAPAFKDFRTEGMALSADQNIPLDAVLEPAGTSTSVNVEGQKLPASAIRLGRMKPRSGLPGAFVTA
jgi:hypothetical protein